MARMAQITPFVMVSDLDRGIAFYTDILGFRAGSIMPGLYGFLRRDSVAIRLLQTSPDTDLSDERQERLVYIDVDDVDALYADLAPKLSQLPQGRVRPPFNQDYGQREFHVSDEDCTLFLFGQEIDTAT